MDGSQTSNELPGPVCSIVLELPEDGSAVDLSALPNGPGVFAFENEAGQTMSLAVAANVRRLVRRRLTPVEREDGPTRRVDFSKLARRVAAAPVGSTFEADWAYLQLARQRVPHAASTLTDRWRGWFVHVNPRHAFPRLVKTSTPGQPPTGTEGVYLGPVADKHTAARLIEALQGGFDLCRYHHILIEAPNGRACAYKEMGRCPAPCDGTVSMAHYRAQVEDAVAFAGRRDDALTTLEARMAQHSADLDFEAAERCRRQIEDLQPITKPAFAHVDRLERFRYIAVAQGEHPDFARMFVIAGGWIAPVADVPIDREPAALPCVVEPVNAYLDAHAVTFESAALENIGLVCAHLFRPKRTARRSVGGPAVFRKCAEGCTAAMLQGAIKALRRRIAREEGRSPGDDDEHHEQVIDVLEQAEQ